MADLTSLNGAALPAGRAAARPRGGSGRSAALSAAFAALFASGLWLWLRPGEGLVVLAHFGLGLGFLLALLPWAVPHVGRGRGLSRRPGFAALGWGLVAGLVLVLGSGLFLAAPALLWWAGRVWFPPAAVTALASAVHFWATWPAMAVLVLHLGLRHWRR